MNEQAQEVVNRVSQFYPSHSEDIQQEAETYLLEYPRSPTALLAAHLKNFLKEEGIFKRQGVYTLPADELDKQRGTPTGRISAAAPPKMTQGQRKRFRRDLVIQAAHRQGCSQRLLAEVMGLPPSHIAKIVKKRLGY